MKRWTTQITQVGNGRLETHGIDQAELIRQFTYVEMIYFILLGTAPTAVQARMLEGVLVSHASHGITGQSTLAVRMAADCGSAFLSSAIGGFSVGSGTYHQGALEAAMREIQKYSDTPSDDRVAYLEAKVASGARFFGFGHRFHKGGDPRARALYDLATAQGFGGDYLDLCLEMERQLSRLKNLHSNIESACAAILLDLHFDPRIAHLFILLGRAPMFAAAYLERLSEVSKPFPKIEVWDIE